MAKKKSFKDWSMEQAINRQQNPFTAPVNSQARTQTSPSMVTPMLGGGLYKSLLEKSLLEASKYAQQNPSNVFQLANSLAGKSMYTPKTGDLSNWDFDTARQGVLDRVAAINALSGVGMFDKADFAYDPMYSMLPSLGFLKKQLDEAKASLTKSIAKDEEVSKRNSSRANNWQHWSDMKNRLGEKTEENEPYFWAFAEYLQNGDTTKPFDANDYLNKYNQAWDEMSDEEYWADIDKRKNWFEALDWGTLTNKDASVEDQLYKSETSGWKEKVNGLQKEITRRGTVAALEQAAREMENFNALSVYNNPGYTPVEPRFADVASAVYAKVKNQYVGQLSDLQYFINSGKGYSAKMAAAEHDAAVRKYLDAGYDYLTADEIAVYNALYSQDLAKAQEYLDAKSPELLMRRAQVHQAHTETLATNPWTALPTWAAARAQGVLNVAKIPQQIYEAAKGNDNPYSSAYDMLNRQAWTGQAQTEVLNNLDAPDWVKKATTYAYKGLTGAADNATRLLATGANPTAALIIAGLQSGSGSLQESASRDDMPAAAKIIKAIGAGAMEIGTEKIGLDALFDQGKKGAMSYIKNVIASELGEETINYLSEDALESVVSFLFDYEADIKSGDEFWQGLTDTWITTAISGGLMGAGGATGNYLNTSSTGAYVKNQGDADAILSIAEGMQDGSQAKQTAAKIREKQGKNKKVTNYQLGQVTQQLATELDEENSRIVDQVMDDAITDRLVELGEDKATAQKNASAIRKLSRGQKLTMDERLAVKWSDNATQVVKELSRETAAQGGGQRGASGNLSQEAAADLRNEHKINQSESPTEMSRDTGLDNNSNQDGGQRGAAGNLRQEAPVTVPVTKAEGQRTGQKWVTAMQKTADGATAGVRGKIAQAQIATISPVGKAANRAEATAKMRVPKRDGKPKQATDSRVSFKAADGNTEVSGDILRFEESEDGMNVVVQTGKGKEGEQLVKLEDWDSADGEGVATIMAYVGDEQLPHSMTAEAANTLLQAYKHSGGNAKAVIQAFDVNYLAGYSGVDQVPSVLDPTISKIAYENGKRDAEKYEANRVQRAQQARKIDTPAVGWLGDVSDNAQIRGSGDAAALDGAVKKMTDGQRYVVEYGKALAQKARINVVFFNSKADPSGKFTADNGRYDRNTHTIYLDINAGINDSKALNAAQKAGTLGYAMMRTLGHEVTHAIEATSVEYYAQYKQAVKNALKAKGHDWATLVRYRIDEAIAEGKMMTYGEAESEVVADASEYMLQDADFSKGLDTGIVDKIKAVVKDFVTKLNDIFRALGKSGSVESHALREMQNGVYHYMGGLQELWGAAFEEMTGVHGQLGQQVEATTGDNEIPLSERFNVNEDEIHPSDRIEIDSDTGSASVQSSARTWRGSDYVAKRDEMAQKLSSSIDVPVSKARKWIDDVSSIAAYILDNKARVDYIPTSVKGVSAFKSNPEYGGSIDMSTICAKRRLATGTLDAIQRVLGDEVLTKDDFLRIREMMKERGHEVACGLCFVESSRKNLSKYNAQFMEQYNRTHPDGQISMTDLNTVDGLESLRLNNEDAYGEYEKFMNKLAQRKPKLFEKRTEYNHEILKKFRSDTTVDIKNLNGGLRLQSFSDFEIVHLIDMMQVITDMASVGLAGQAYTKVPDFAWALGDTGLKINLSLIAKGVDADGNLIFDDVEGMNHNEARKLRNAYSKNVGTIVVTFTDEQLLAAMKSDMVDYIIPFHRSQWQKGDYKKLGLPEGTKDYTLHQNEKQGRKRVKENLLPNAYWDFSLSGKENAEKYLSLCASSGRTPKFAKFLVNNGDGTYSLQPDGSTDGYWKLLIDFKMYDNQGNGSPQLPVQPTFNMEEAMRMLEEYKGEHDSFPVAQDVVDDFVEEYRGDKGGVQMVDGRYTLAPIQSSARRNAPDDITTRDYLAESDDSIAETVEERNALTIYQKLLKNHADASEAVMAAEQALEAAPEAKKPEARKALAAARAEQRDLYNRLLNIERTAHVQSVISRTNQFMADELQGKSRKAVEKAIADREAKIAELKADLTGLKGAAKTQREADIRQHERIVARFKSKATQMVLENSEKYQRQIADIRLRRDINIEIGKKTRHIKRVVKALNDRIVHEEDYKNVKEPLKPAVHTLVRTFVDGFGNLVFDQKTADRLRGVYDAIANEDAAPDFYSDDVANWLADLASMKELDTIIRAEGSSSLSAAEEKLVMYSRVADIADHIYKMVTDADEIFINGKRASIAAVSGEVGDELVAKPDKPLLVGKARDAVRIADDLLRTGNMTPQYFFDHLKNSGLTKLFDGLMDGQQQYAQAIREGQEAVAAAKDKYNFYSWQNMKEGVEFRTEQGHRIALTVPQMMWVYATAKREATNTLMDTHHLDQGGFRYESNALPREKGKMTAIPGSDKLHKLSAKDVAKITDTLTSEQKACADELVGYLSEDCAEMGNEASMKLFGIKKYNEEYYFPFKTAGDQRYQRSDAGSTSTTNDARVKHASFTHSLRKGANTPLVMGDFFDVIADHINMMATYSSFVVPIESMNRVLNTKVNEDADGNGNDVTIRSLVGTKYGEPAQKYIADLMKDLNGGPQTDNRGGISALFRAFKRGAVMGSLSVTLQQPTAVARAMAYVNPKYFLHLTGEGNKKTWERMMRYSGAAVIKDMGKFDVGTGKMANDWIANSDLQSYNVWKRGKFLLHTEGWNAVKNNYVDFLTALPGVMDRVTWTHIWKAIEAEQADLNPSMDHNSDDFLTAVGKRFDDVINHTQVYDSILAKSQNMRSKNPLTQMSTAFMSEPTLNINMLYDAVRGEHDAPQRAAIITSVIASNILAAAMASLISAWNKDDDERKLSEKYLTEFANRAIESVNPLTMIPYIADLWSMIDGYDIERTDWSVVKDILDYGSKFFSNAHDPEKANTWRDYENFFGTIANLLGVPAKNISRDIRRVRNLIMTDKSAASGSSLRYSLLETITPFGLYASSNTAYYERMLAATKDGDKQEMYDLKDYLMATKGVKESTITSGVRNAYKNVYLRGGITKNEAVSFLLANNLVAGETDTERKKSAFEYVDKWGEGTDGYSAYNTLRKAFADGNGTSIQKAWDELEANGWSNDSIGSYVRGTIIKEMVTSGQITPAKATELIRKWYPYKKDKDNINKPKEWLNSK